MPRIKILKVEGQSYKLAMSSGNQNDLKNEPKLEVQSHKYVKVESVAKFDKTTKSSCGTKV